MDMRILLRASLRLQEAVRPNHVHALARNQHPDVADVVYSAIAQIERALDGCLARVHMGGSYMKVWHNERRIHVQINLRWSVMPGDRGGAPMCSIRIGLDTPITYFPAEYIDDIRDAIIERYRKADWKVEITDQAIMFSHPEG